MSSIEVRPFERRGREQLTALVNRHVGAVLPGVAVSVNTVMSQLEREPNEAIVDPWVIERRTFVCFARQAIVAGAHLLRYGSEEPVGDYYRDVGEIHWLVCNPSEPLAGERLMAQCMQIMDGWVSRVDTPTGNCRHWRPTAFGHVGLTFATFTRGPDSRTAAKSS